jgi:hypothetical protein
MLDNTDSDVLTLLPKNGFSAPPKTVSAPVSADNSPEDEDDSLGFSSGAKSTPAVPPAPVREPEVVSAPVPPAPAGRSVPKLTVPPKFTVPGKKAVLSKPQSAPDPAPVSAPAEPVKPAAEPPAQGGGKVMFNVTAPPPKKKAEPPKEKTIIDHDGDFAVRRGPVSTDDFLQVGQIVGQYVIEEKLPPKGNFLRFKIFHTKLQVHREAHLLNPQIIYEKEKLPSYFSERVSKFSTLPHPNLRNVLYVINEPQNGFFGIVLEAVQSGTLADDPDFGKMPIEKAKRIIIAVATALSYFELVGVTHGSVNAGNITRSEDGHDIKLDGLMDIYSFSGGGLQGGHFQGIQRDLYCAGLLFYEMLTGQQPPAKNALKTVNLDPRVHAPEIPGDIALLVIRLLAPTAMTRFTSAADFLLTAQSLTSTQNALANNLVSSNREVSRLLKDFSVWKVAVVILTLIACMQVLRYIDSFGHTPVSADPEYVEMQKAYVAEADRTQESLDSFAELLQEWDKEMKQHHKARGKK